MWVWFFVYVITDRNMTNTGPVFFVEENFLFVSVLSFKVKDATVSLLHKFPYFSWCKPLNAHGSCFTCSTWTWLWKITLSLQARCATADKILTGNHWGIAVLLLVAVFVGTEALHKAQVALSQELVRDKANTRRSEEQFLRVSWSTASLLH